jgi:hypothetical protein
VTITDDLIPQALSVLVALGFPKAQCNERSALCLLALLNFSPGKNWEQTEQPLLGITPMMQWILQHYQKEYAANTRETLRRQTIHQFVDAGLLHYNPDQPDRAVNSPKAVYQITATALVLLQSFGSDTWAGNLAVYLSNNSSLTARYASERQLLRLQVALEGGQNITLSPGQHSALITSIITDFAPRFAPGSELVYAGDTGDKLGYLNAILLKDMAIELDLHGKMPDVILYYREKHWLLLVEAVTSHGPIDNKRHAELAHLFAASTAGLVYVTAFPDRTVMKRYRGEIAWESEVWVADAPSHLIHFDGTRFLGPY